MSTKTTILACLMLTIATPFSGLTNIKEPNHSTTSRVTSAINIQNNQNIFYYYWYSQWSKDYSNQIWYHQVWKPKTWDRGYVANEDYSMIINFFYNNQPNNWLIIVYNGYTDSSMTYSNIVEHFRIYHYIGSTKPSKDDKVWQEAYVDTLRNKSGWCNGYLIINNNDIEWNGKTLFKW